MLIAQSYQAQTLNLIALAGLVALFCIAIHPWVTLPDTIPIHFGFDGQANGWGSKKNLWLLPIVGLAIYGLLTAAKLLSKLSEALGAKIHNHPKLASGKLVFSRLASR